MTTTPETIAELRKLLAEATPGPWEIASTPKICKSGKGVLAVIPTTATDGVMEWCANKQLIAAAVNALPSLLSDLEAAQNREQVLREALDRLTIGISPASIDVQCHGNIAKHDANLVALAGACGQIAFAALAATEAK
jgi:hypothetical protein